MQESRDIYKKPSREGTTGGYEPLKPPDFKSTHRRAVILFILMVISLIGVTMYFSRDKDSEATEYDYLLNRPPPETSAPPVRLDRPLPDAGTFENLLTDLGISSQTPPPWGIANVLWRFR